MRASPCRPSNASSPAPPRPGRSSTSSRAARRRRASRSSSSSAAPRKPRGGPPRSALSARSRCLAPSHARNSRGPVARTACSTRRAGLSSQVRSLTRARLRTWPFGLEVLPEAAGDQRLLPAAGERGGRLEVVVADHHVQVQAGAVDAAALPLLPRVAEAGAEREVRGRVLVEEGVVVDPPLVADARGRVDEGDLAEPARVRLRIEERGEEVA